MFAWLTLDVRTVSQKEDAMLELKMIMGVSSFLEGIRVTFLQLRASSTS